MENLWETLKQKIYKDGKQSASKEDLFRSMQMVAKTLPRCEITKLAESVDKRIVKVIQLNGSFVNC